jgi:hypothetical protein
LGRASWSCISRLIGAEVGADVIDQRVPILGIYLGSPFNHLVDFFGPGGLAQALLHNDARFVTDRTRGDGFFLHGASRQLVVGIGIGRRLSGKRSGGSEDDERQNYRAQFSEFTFTTLGP